MVSDAILAAGILVAVQGGVGSAETRHIVAAAVAVAFVLVASAAFGGYDVRAPSFGGGTALLGRMLLLALAASGLAWMVVDALGGELQSGRLAFAALAMALLWTIGRVAARAVWRAKPERVLVIGTGPTARSLLALTRRHPEHGLQVVGFVDDSPLALGADDPPVVGGLNSLRKAALENEVDRIIVAFGPAADADVLESLRRCDGLDVEIDVVPRMFDLIGYSPAVRSIGGLPLVRVRPLGGRPCRRAMKRAFDIAGASVLLVVMAPVLAAVSAAILVVDGRPVFFRQARVGRGGRRFTILKFRTMRAEPKSSVDVDVGADSRPAAPVSFDQMKRDSVARVTRLGRLLRRTSLDELPQLLNVLRGDMSLVGPRPLPRAEAESLSSWQLTRQTARPGITGLWQVLGRSEIEWNERMQLDYAYVRHWSLAQDVHILAGTVRAVCSRRGAI